MEGAMKLARQYWFEQGQTQRTRFVARCQSWHGTTLGAISMSSNLPRKIPYQPLLIPNVSHVSPAFAYHYQDPSESESTYVTRLAEELDAEFQYLGPSNVIAFVAEPVVGATSGCVTAPKGYFKAIREICDKYGILLIRDEVMCGVGRTGTFFAFEQEDIVPDIVTIGKGLGSGYAPIAGILVHEKVVNILQKGTGSFNHGHTYQAHVLSCAIALSVQQIVRRERLVERCKHIGQLLESRLRRELEDCKYVGDIRGRGLFWAAEFVRDRQTRESFEPSLGFGQKVQLRAFEYGVALYPGMATVDGVRGDHVIVAPPYTVTEEELKHIVRVLKDAYTAEEASVDRLLANSAQAKL